MILAQMDTRKTIAIIVTSVYVVQILACLGKQITEHTKQAPIYRIEERSRTIYVSSDVDPTQWDTHILNTIFTRAEDLLSPGSSSLDLIERNHESVSRRSVFRGRLPGIKSAPHLSTNVVLQGSHSKPSSARNRILFYHKNDPYYGFTNFSPHPVIYKGKKYPTSEHLFQSFKVRGISISLLIFTYDPHQFQAHRPSLAEHIRTCSERPSVALSEARRFQREVRADWKKVNIKMVCFAVLYSLDGLLKKDT